MVQKGFLKGMDTIQGIELGLTQLNKKTKLEEIAPMSWWRKKGWEDKKGFG